MQSRVNRKCRLSTNSRLQRETRPPFRGVNKTSLGDVAMRNEDPEEVTFGTDRRYCRKRDKSKTPAAKRA